MTDMILVIPLPEAFRADAAALYLTAFGGKIGPVLGCGTRARAFLADSINPAQALAAVSRDGRSLLGVAGMRDASGAFMGGGLAELSRHYGMLGGLARGLALSVLERDAAPGILQMDGICVAEDARGQGVGSALLRAMAAEARSRGAAELRLEVVDTNPRAAALYARNGFREVKRTDVGPLRHLFGFRSAVTMTLAV
jgi:ribosomal protein S18 acetylase RimI-like enzyme